MTYLEKLERAEEALVRIRSLIPINCAAWGIEQEIVDICDETLSLIREGRNA
jgi:hypothetical protein